jgi:hypothetical protein
LITEMNLGHPQRKFSYNEENDIRRLLRNSPLDENNTRRN